MAKIYDLKKTLKSNPEIAKLILPSSKSEIFFDLDGKGHIDFAYIDGKGTGEVDTFAFDMTGDGSLDVYFVDYDGNGVADTVKYYPDGADTPRRFLLTRRSSGRSGPCPTRCTPPCSPKTPPPSSPPSAARETACWRRA